MTEKGVSRVHYFDRQFLGVQDFVDEQAYEVAMRRRHNLAGHTWGIVSGLQLTVEQGSLSVQPGMAIDGFGRELVLVTKEPINTEVFDNKQSDKLGVWLQYNLLGTDSPPAGYDSCSADAGLFYRWQEKPLIWLLVPDPAHPNPREPKQVLENDRNFGPTLTSPDDPLRSWPVFLGLIQRDPKNQKQPYSVDLSGRPYGGLVGESIVAPSGRAQVQLGSEEETDSNRFAVLLPRKQDPKSPASEIVMDPYLAIDKTGNLSVQGETTINGNLTVSNGSVEFGVSQASSGHPWTIYSHLETQQGSELRRELRIEIDGNSGGKHQVVIGVWSAQNKFKPILTIADDSTVTVHGNLIVEGKVDGNINGAPVPPPPLSPEASSVVTGSFLSGAGGSPVLLAQTGASAMHSEESIRAAAHTLSSSPGHLSKFVDVLKKDFSHLAAELHAKLHPSSG
jgi:hypothetical protein